MAKVAEAGAQRNGDATTALQRMQSQPVEYMGQRVITLAMMDEAHGRPAGTAKRTFAQHKSKLVEGEDYFKVLSSELSTSNVPRDSPDNCVILLTESGYLMLAKPMRDELSWTVQREIVRVYFRARELVAPMSESHALLAQTVGALAQAAQGLADANRRYDSLNHALWCMDKSVQKLTRRSAEAARIEAGWKPRRRAAKKAAPQIALPLAAKKKKGAA